MEKRKTEAWKKVCQSKVAVESCCLMFLTVSLTYMILTAY